MVQFYLVETLKEPFLKDEAPLSFMELYLNCSSRSSVTLTALFILETSWWTWWSQATPSGKLKVRETLQASKLQQK